MRLILVCALASAGLLVQPADARSRERNDERGARQEQQQPQERREDKGHRGDRSAAAARRAQERNGGGKVLSVEPEARGYRVKVLKDGEVRTHHVED